MLSTLTRLTQRDYRGQRSPLPWLAYTVIIGYLRGSHNLHNLWISFCLICLSFCSNFFQPFWPFFWVHESVPSCAIPAGPQELGDLSEDSGLQVVCQRLPLLERHSSTHFVQAVNTAINRCRIWGRAWRLGEEHLQETSFFIHEHHGRWGFHGISWYFMVFHGISWFFL